MSMLDTAVPFQLVMWGYAMTGHTGEIGASYAEGRGREELTLPGRAWDYTRRNLQGQTLNGQPVPESWALPWVTEQIMRQEMRVSTTSPIGDALRKR